MSKVMMIMLKKKTINSKNRIIYYLNDVALSQKVSHFYCLIVLLNYITQNIFNNCMQYKYYIKFVTIKETLNCLS